MGYRSDVAIAVKKSDYIAFRTKFESDPILSEVKEWFACASIDDYDVKGNLWTVIKWEWVKWYRELDPEGVDRIEAWMHSLETYEFAYAGEDGGDVESEEKGEDTPNFFDCYCTNILQVNY